jgi:hypothetical protein
VTTKAGVTSFGRHQEQGCRLTAADNRREDGPAGTTGDRLRDDVANTQIARLRCGHDRWQQQGNDLAEHSTNQAGHNVTDRAEVEIRRCLARTHAARYRQPSFRQMTTSTTHFRFNPILQSSYCEGMLVGPTVDNSAQAFLARIPINMHKRMRPKWKRFNC